MSDSGTYSIMVHGGAGALDNVKDNKTALRYLDSIRTVVEHGRTVMELGGSALQAVEACASLLEDDPVFNAGCGSVLNENGKVELDAAIMNGRDLSAGAVAAVDNIVGIKEATGDLDRARELIDRCGDRLDIYSGDDATAMELMLMGGKGNISVTANVAPQAMHDMCMAALSGDRETAGQINGRLDILHRTLFIESNPIPVKWALHEMGLVPEGIRLPLTPLDEKYRDTLRQALAQAGVLASA